MSHKGLNEDEFAKLAHEKISAAFTASPDGGTPLYGKLESAFKNHSSKIMHYVFTDGEPSDRTPEDTAQLVINRNHADLNPITFMSCTNDDKLANWMKVAEDKAKFASELDDFKSESKEVRAKQGKAFPFNKGMWLLCQLVAAINPDDLDKLDEKKPFSRAKLSEILGRKLTRNDYNHYFSHHPRSAKYQKKYEQLCGEDEKTVPVSNYAAGGSTIFAANVVPPMQPSASAAVPTMNPASGY